MEFNELDESSKEFFKKVYLDKRIKWADKVEILRKFIKKSDRTVSNWAKKLGLSKKEEPESEELNKAKKKKFNSKKKRFIISWAQNNTPVHERFLKNIEAYATYINAEIHIIAGRYRNPTSIFGDQDKEKWHSKVLPYLDAARHNIHKYVSIMSDVKIQPTAISPMTGLEGLSGVNSCIFGSPKVHLKMIPVLEGNKPKIMITTGACTIENYSDSKAGKKGEFHHTLGFAIVEIKDDDTFFVRQVTAEENGNFIDLYNSVEFLGKKAKVNINDPVELVDWKNSNFKFDLFDWIGHSKISKIVSIDACILGDIHSGEEDKEVLSKTLDFLKVIKPEYIILHDIFDGYSISHHTMKDPFIQYKKEISGKNSLKNEIAEMLNTLNSFSEFNNVIIVRSNHDDFLDRWLKSNDWKNQPSFKNSLEYLEFSKMLLEQYTSGKEVIGIIPEIINKEYPEFITLNRSSSFIINGWEVGQHGDIGSNGSRGSLSQFRKMNTKIIVGHYHTPGRIDGAISVGTTTKLRLGYNRGPSSWLHSHVIIHKNGKAQHINFIDGEFTTM